MHLSTTPGTYHPMVTVTDKDGDSGEDDDNTIEVKQTYTVDFLPPFDDSTPSGLIVNKMKNSRVVPVKATIYDDCTQSYVTDPGTDVTIKVTKTSGTGTGDPVEGVRRRRRVECGNERFPVDVGSLGEKEGREERREAPFPFGRLSRADGDGRAAGNGLGHPFGLWTAHAFGSLTDAGERSTLRRP